MQSTELYHGRNKTNLFDVSIYFILCYLFYPNLCVAYHFFRLFSYYVHLYLYFHVFICSQMLFMMVL